ncbi:GRIP domain-containing protein RUD3-like [Pyrus ussuriensis x Pyrus communis]|uniref:GRIP domain-containing protein RUD3-like n=1 Tax=Pyrus ussuriensis x Pyrus communis TaxID=2448454 RepID=A0A5N5FSF5_9ROSA|nr:GRIP domain-containing protein RUD3-like [Pyrus ussuriensis x Pyrus communis]
MPESLRPLLESCIGETLDDLHNRQTCVTRFSPEASDEGISEKCRSKDVTLAHIGSSFFMLVVEGVALDAIPIFRFEFIADHLDKNFLDSEEQLKALSDMRHHQTVRSRTSRCKESVEGAKREQTLGQAMTFVSKVWFPTPSFRVPEISDYRGGKATVPAIDPIFPLAMEYTGHEGDPSSNHKRKYKEEVAMQPNSFRLKGRNGENLRLKKQLEVTILEASKVREELDSALAEVSELKGSIPTKREAAMQEFLGSQAFCHAIRPHCTREIQLEKRKWMAILERYDDGNIIDKYHEEMEEY